VAAATIIVSNANDDGAGSLRQAINSASSGDTITFGISGTITLTGGEIVIDKDLTITGPGTTTLSVSGNNASRVLHIAGGNVDVSHVTVTEGFSGSLGGSIIIDETGSLSLEGTIIRNNIAGLGGGISNQGSLTLTNVTIDRNSAEQWGGGIINTGILRVRRSTVSNNAAIIGGGLLNAASLSSGGRIQSGTADLENVTISGNTASDFGGGIVNSGTNIGGTVTSTSLVLANCTVNNNSALTGGGLFNQFGTTTARNTIVANSSSGGNCDSTITSLGHNLDSSNTCAFTGTGDLINTKPLLGPLALNAPGTTQTHALLIGSPAIDTADPVIFPPIDQRGIARPQGAAPDIGAYEFVPSPTATVPTMTEWGMVIFMMLAGIGSLYFLSRQKRV
jgi:hypothetical protein